LSKSSYKFIFAAGGTGGHLFPAIAVAEQLKLLCPKCIILFVGTKDKIESKVVPELGYKFKTIWVSGFTRRLTLKNLLFPVKLIVSTLQSFTLNLRFKSDVAIGAGAYVAGPVISTAALLGSKIVLLEQNSYPGVTNRILEKKADRIHLSFEDSKKYFKCKDKLFVTGNPVRTTLKVSDRIKAAKEFQLNPDRKILLILGGSLGAGSLNKSVAESIELFKKNDIQLIWQTGEKYFKSYQSFQNDSIKIMPFISDMSTAYSSCDLVVARAGATTIAEIAFLGLPVIFVPSVNVAANHQYMNAKSIADLDAGILIEDKKLKKEFTSIVLQTIKDNDLLLLLKNNIKKISKPEAAYDIAKDILSIAQQKIKS
jgi:UDP-N-acetylglucosamine--N-acetylmuramyl-(pentapeptide) pyrophosphoryl-undecaprenol N-acetylglucosamine transferase